MEKNHRISLVISSRPMYVFTFFSAREPHIYVGEYGEVSHVQSRHKINLDFMMLLGTIGK